MDHLNHKKIFRTSSDLQIERDKSEIKIFTDNIYMLSKNAVLSFTSLKK